MLTLSLTTTNTYFLLRSAQAAAAAAAAAVAKQRNLPLFLLPAFDASIDIFKPEQRTANNQQPPSRLWRTRMQQPLGALVCTACPQSQQKEVAPAGRGAERQGVT